MRRIKSDDWIDQFFDYNIEPLSRTLYLGSQSGDEEGVNYQMAEKFLKGIHILEQHPLPIKIKMNNPGGDWYHGMAIYDAIDTCESFVTIEAYGYVMSMGSLILQAADKRLMSPNSKMMIHYGYNNYPENHPKINKAWLKEDDRTNVDMENLYLKRIREKHPKYPISELKKLLDFDTFFTAEQAIDLGLCDEKIIRK